MADSNGEDHALRSSAASRRLEITGLHVGTSYSILVRAKTEHGWGPASEALVARTMRPTDFPVPLLAPSVAQREGCTSLRLRLPPPNG